MEAILEGRPELAAEIDKVAEVAGYLWQKGWAERNGGNITVNVTEFVDDSMRSLPALGEARPIGARLNNLKGSWFYCKGSGKRMRDLSVHPMENGSLIRILEDCSSYEIVADKPVVPTSELPSHLMLHDYLVGSGSNYKACLHTHPIELVAMSHKREFLEKDVLTKILWSMIPETLAFAPLGLGIVPYETPGSIDLAEATLEQIVDYDVVLWEKHGVTAVGPDIMEAFDQVDVLNKSACIYKSSCSMGFIPEGMTDKAVSDIRRIFKLPDRRISSE